MPRENSKKIQLFPKWKQLPPMVKTIIPISVAKNYLSQEEIKNLNEIVTMYLDYAERQAKRGQVMYMIILFVIIIYCYN
ncbi:MAG: virulence RhuM family protein [Fibrobacter sp.]|nr:virulence RhuM family protein [Fibrobacter sp.]